jgi:hypothetical protein
MSGKRPCPSLLHPHWLKPRVAQSTALLPQNQVLPPLSVVYRCNRNLQFRYRFDDLPMYLPICQSTKSSSHRITVTMISNERGCNAMQCSTLVETCPGFCGEIAIRYLTNYRWALPMPMCVDCITTIPGQPKARLLMPPVPSS